MNELIIWLQKWYQSQCNGDWEHSYGITIQTLDNPGWSLFVNLDGTMMEERSF
jgi:Immunity protein 53